VKLARDRAAERLIAEQMAGMGAPAWATRPQVYRGHDFQCFVGREHCGGREASPLRWHISVRGPDRLPTWEEMVEIAHELRPGVPFVISVPPRSLWLNLHPHVHHLWETGDEALMEEWRANATGQAPT
jgi:hypothetical protein